MPRETDDDPISTLFETGERLEALLLKFTGLCRHAAIEDTPLIAVPREELWQLLALIEVERATLRLSDFWGALQENEQLRRVLEDISLGEENADPGWSKARRALIRSRDRNQHWSTSPP